MEIKSRNYYECLFGKYADVVELNTLREMLGGVSDSYIRPLLQNGTIKSFKMDKKIYKIPKCYIVDFVISDAYQNNKHKLKAQI